MTAYRDYEALSVTATDGVLTIAFNRPEVRNAVNAEVHAELERVFDDFDRDGQLKVGILTGVGGAFSAGGDQAFLRRLSTEPDASIAAVRADRRIQNTLLDLEKPLIAKVVGPAVGLGCSLALYCDFIYATPDSVFADPHAAVGLVAGDGGALLWPQLVGYARAKRYLLLGDPILGAEAAEIGLITEAVDIAEIEGVVEALAARLCAAPQLALRWTKASVNAGLKVVANAVLDRSAAFENLSQLHAEHAEALDRMFSRQSRGVRV